MWFGSDAELHREPFTWSWLSNVNSVSEFVGPEEELHQALALFSLSSPKSSMTSPQQNAQANFQDLLPNMADKVGGDGLIGELCNGFNLLMDPSMEVITFKNIKRNSTLLGLQDLSDNDLRSKLQKGDFDGHWIVALGRGGRVVESGFGLCELGLVLQPLDSGLYELRGVDGDAIRALLQRGADLVVVLGFVRDSGASGSNLDFVTFLGVVRSMKSFGFLLKNPIIKDLLLLLIYSVGKNWFSIEELKWMYMC